MEALWNHMQLERPPNVTCCIKRQNFDAATFLMALEKIIKELTSQELLHKEAALLSRLIYRMKTKFRNDKGVKSMFKVNRALLNYLSLALEKEYINLKSYVEVDDHYIILPSKQMMEYVLIRTQGFAKLMLRIEEVSKLSAHFLKGRIGLGHAWSVAVIAYAVVSRIWILSRWLVKQSCTWYNDLYKYLKVLTHSGVPWLPEDYKLTHDLKLWLSIRWIDEPTPRVPSSYGLKNTMFKLIIPREYDSDEDLALDVQNYNNETNFKNASLFVKEESVIRNIVPKDENKSIATNDDTGEIIDRHTFNLKHTKNVSAIAKEKKHKDIISIEKPKEEKHQVISSQNNDNEKNNSDNKNKNTNSKQDKNFAMKSNLIKKKNSEKLLTLDDVKNKSDLIALLNRESYPGLDKLRWNMIRNKSKKLLCKLNDCSNETNQTVVLKKIMKRIQLWIS